MSDVALDPDYTLEQVAEALQMSERWVRDRIREGAPHQRYGNKIRFTAAQVEQLRAGHPTSAAPTAITTGRRRRP